MFKQTKCRIRQYDNKNVTLTPKQRTFMKKVGNKQLRKQHKNAIEAGLREYTDWLYVDSQYYWEEDLEYENSYDYYLDQNPEYDDEDYQDQQYDDYYDDWDYDPIWGDHQVSRDDINELVSNRVISYDDAGMRIGQLLASYGIFLWTKEKWLSKRQNYR